MFNNTKLNKKKRNKKGDKYNNNENGKYDKIDNKHNNDVMVDRGETAGRSDILCIG